MKVEIKKRYPHKDEVLYIPSLTKYFMGDIGGRSPDHQAPQKEEISCTLFAPPTLVDSKPIFCCLRHFSIFKWFLNYTAGESSNRVPNELLGKVSVNRDTTCH